MKTIFPYKANTIDGFFTYIKGDRSLYSTDVQPLLSQHYFDYCLDREPQTYCHTSDTTNGYFLVNLKPHKFHITGYGIQNRADGYHNPLHWQLHASVDGLIYDIIDTVDQGSDQCANGQNRTRKVETANLYSFFKFFKTGTTCSGASSMNLAEFEIFGKFFPYFEKCTKKSFLFFRTWVSTFFALLQN